MHILVTGGYGFIGSHLIRHLLARGKDHVVNLDALEYSGNLDNLVDVADHPRYTFVHGNICDAETVGQVLRAHRVEVVINCAGRTHVDRSLLDPVNFVKTNVIGTALLLEAARTVGVHRFVQISTDEVYGSVESGWSRETDTLCPRNPYSASKASADLLARNYWLSYQLPVLITRGGNTYGPNQYPEKFVPLVITNALQNEPVPLHGDGHDRRDWLSVFDHCAAIDLVLRCGEPGTVYNVGGGNEVETFKVVEMILKQVDKPMSLVRFVENRPGHDRRYAVDSSRLRALGWTPGVSFEKGLQETVNWYRGHEAWWKQARSEEFRAYYKQIYAQRFRNSRPWSSRS